MRPSALTGITALKGFSAVVIETRGSEASTEVSERAGIAAETVSKIEHGNLGVAIGTVFEVATLVGVPLFHEDRCAWSSTSTARRAEARCWRKAFGSARAP